MSGVLQTNRTINPLEPMQTEPMQKRAHKSWSPACLCPTFQYLANRQNSQYTARIAKERFPTAGTNANRTHANTCTHIVVAGPHVSSVSISLTRIIRDRPLPFTYMKEYCEYCMSVAIVQAMREHPNTTNANNTNIRTPADVAAECPDATHVNPGARSCSAFAFGGKSTNR